MKKYLLCLIAIVGIFYASCNKEVQKEKPQENILSLNLSESKMTNYMSNSERKKIKTSKVSQKQKYYHYIADIAEHIIEMSIYDKELNSTYIIHIVLPPNYNPGKSYPMYMMTDGIWRLSDHAKLRQMMLNEEIEDIITVSVGYNYGANAESPEIRFVEFVQKADLFLDFLTNRLAPYLGEQFNIDYSRSTLMGHSLGGLFTYYAVFNHDKYKNNPFNYYIIASPAFFVSNNRFRGWKYGNIEERYFSKNNTLEKNIYLTAGDNEGFESTMPDIENFLQNAEKNGITTIDFEIFKGDHSSYLGAMISKSALKFYGK